tara:strand:- start:667 stop:972 length:306 start_codon:yes stop_codon:yes gene_type:complete
MPKRILTEEQRKKKIEGSKRWNLKNREKMAKYRKGWLAKMSKEEKTEYFRKYNKRYTQRRRIKTINNFILFLAQTCEIIIKTVPDYELNRFVRQGVSLKLR